MVEQNGGSPHDSALARWSCSSAMASVRAHGPTPKARSTILASPMMPPWRAKARARPIFATEPWRVGAGTLDECGVAGLCGGVYGVSRECVVVVLAPVVYESLGCIARLGGVDLLW